jgi:transposase-like protein
MASKGQKFNKYSVELKQEIVQKYLDGKGTARSLGKEYGISYKTIDNMIYRYKHPELKTGRKIGRPKEKNLTKEDWKERYEILKKYQAFLKTQREKK